MVSNSDYQEMEAALSRMERRVAQLEHLLEQRRLMTVRQQWTGEVVEHWGNGRTLVRDAKGMLHACGEWPHDRDMLEEIEAHLTSKHNALKLGNENGAAALVITHAYRLDPMAVATLMNSDEYEDLGKAIAKMRGLPG
jgi:hypothetical protein